ncbi:hypothetical protein CHS0354_002967 [Potamilus streckersoni]|uniref:Uncharacterized protein n=1 Tax=Potamilus streckersoni TaxID=2493646 RepID=A0AAE0RS21_9BIVA|nr:hypothetical protein CHS0354_002967 [Potamilus streckersoni]
MPKNKMRCISGQVRRQFLDPCLHMPNWICTTLCQAVFGSLPSYAKLDMHNTLSGSFWIPAFICQTGYAQHFVRQFLDPCLHLPNWICTTLCQAVFGSLPSSAKLDMHNTLSGSFWIPAFICQTGYAQHFVRQFLDPCLHMPNWICTTLCQAVFGSLPSYAKLDMHNTLSGSFWIPAFICQTGYAQHFVRQFLDPCLHLPNRICTTLCQAVFGSLPSSAKLDMHNTLSGSFWIPAFICQTGYAQHFVRQFLDPCLHMPNWICTTLCQAVFGSLPSYAKLDMQSTGSFWTLPSFAKQDMHNTSSFWIPAFICQTGYAKHRQCLDCPHLPNWICITQAGDIHLH